MRGLDLCLGCCCASLSMAFCRTSGGDRVEAFLCGPGDAVLPVAVKDLGNGCYALSSTADKPGTWIIKPRVSNTSKCNSEHCQGLALLHTLQAGSCNSGAGSHIDHRLSLPMRHNSKHGAC